MTFRNVGTLTKFRFYRTFENVGTLTKLDFTDDLRKCGNSHKV
ncbi:hypothetical protein LEP1GSC072_2944 [Leptospira noguchii str. Bonito]|nr:hypothetical protein LEP1GSC072_2944 [Leptospira noguchii str. Bonito]